MRLQDATHNCGVYALLNSLRAIGIQRTAEELETMCGTTATRGTSTAGLMRAAGKIDGCAPVKIREARADVAGMKLLVSLSRGRPVILSWNRGEHWVAAVGMLGDRYLIADSADSETVVSMTIAEVLEHWCDGTHEGVIL